MKKLTVLLLCFISQSLLMALVIETSQFQASSSNNDPALVSLKSAYSTQRSEKMNSPILKVSDFNFLEFNVENEDILNTYFTLEDPTFLVEGDSSSLVVGPFKVAPSPVNSRQTSYFCYRLGSEQAVTLSLYSRRGRLVEIIDISSGSFPGGQAGYQKVPIPNVSSLSAGLYFAFLKVGNVLKRTKFEVQP